MANPLPISRLVNVQVNLSAQAAQGQNLNTLCIVGDSNVILPTERIRFYNSVTAVASDFSTTSPEYLASQLYFAQVPQPANLAIGRWNTSAYPGQLIGGFITSDLAAYLGYFTVITNGSLTLSIDGSVKNLTGLNFSGANSLAGVAAIITTALGLPTCTWDAINKRFVITSSSIGVNSSVGYGIDVGTNTVASLMEITVSTAYSSANGNSAETFPSAVNTLISNYGVQFFGITAATTASIEDLDHINVCNIVQSDQQHIYGITSSAAAILNPASTTDIAYAVKNTGISYAFVQYSSSSPYAAASFFGRALTVNYGGNNTVINLMYKQEPLVFAETLTATQANALQAKNCNVLVSYAANPAVAILQYGTTGTDYFDTIAGLVWLKNQIQLDLFNVLYTSPTKVPQTDGGVNVLTTTVEGTCAQGVTNGLLAPGQWNAPGFGNLQQGDFVPKGYYIYAAPISSQSQADREARKSPPIQVAVKLAGAINTVDVIVTVNR